VSLRTTTVIAVAFAFCSLPAQALSPKYYGKWTDRQGKCKEEERLYRITNKTFDRYESSCRIIKEEAHDPLKLGLPNPKLTLSCSSEGDISKDIVYLSDPTDGMLRIQYESEGDGFRRIYKCSK